jgi:hypothetical protein
MSARGDLGIAKRRPELAIPCDALVRVQQLEQPQLLVEQGIAVSHVEAEEREIVVEGAATEDDLDMSLRPRGTAWVIPANPS